MKREHRNRAIFRILLGFFLLGLIVVMLALLQGRGVPDALLAVAAILLATFGLLFYFQGCFALAKAKGYNDSTVLAGIVVGALCCPGLLLALPLVLAVFLKDKNQRRY